MPVIGFLSGASPNVLRRILCAAFRQGLGEAGYVEGRSVAIEYRWAEGRYERAGSGGRPGPPSGGVIAAIGGLRRARGQDGDRGDPDRLHDRRRSGRSRPVASLNRPGGNITGVTIHCRARAKRSCCASLFRRRDIRLLVNPNKPDASPVEELQAAAARFGLQI